jgi:hypothetical protein
MSNIITLTKNLAALGGLPAVPVINNDQDYKTASDSYLFLRKHFDQAEKLRKVETSPLVESKRTIDAEYEKFTAPLEKVMLEIKSKMAEYGSKQKAAQLAMEAEALDKATGDIIVDSLDVTKSQGEFSSNTLRQVIRYRMKNEALRFIDIPLKAMELYLEKNALPDFVEVYSVDSVTVRGL